MKSFSLLFFTEGSTSLELDGNLYVGGLGPPFTDVPVPSGLWTAVLQQGFVGCFKDLVMNNEPVDVSGYAREQDSGELNFRNKNYKNFMILHCWNNRAYNIQTNIKKACN